MYVCMYVCVRACVRACVSERERDTHTEGGKRQEEEDRQTKWGVFVYSLTHLLINFLSLCICSVYVLFYIHIV